MMMLQGTTQQRAAIQSRISVTRCPVPIGCVLPVSESTMWMMA